MPAAVSSAPRHAAVVFNPVKQDGEALAAALAQAEGEAGYAASVLLETTADDPGSAMTAEALAGGATVVIAAGGDGTVRAVAGRLRDSGVPLGIVPAGTGNLLARNLGLPLGDPAAALRAAFAETERRIDLGVVEIVRADGRREELCFAVMAGIGLDAELIDGADEELKKRAGWLAYGQSAWAALRGGSRIRVRYHLDTARPQTQRVHTLLVGNCGLLPADVVLLPDARIDDGLLDVVLLRPDGLLGWVRIIGQVLVANRLPWRRAAGRAVEGDSGHGTHPLRYRQARRVAVQLREAEPFELDGDLCGEVRGFTCRLDPGGLVVRVPHGAEPAGA